MRSLLALMCCLVCLAVSPGVQAGEWRDVLSSDRVRLPRDLYFRDDYRVQWWYLTGHLFDPSGREYGYELTFFCAGVQRRAFQSAFGVNRIYLSHFALSDVQGRKFFHFSDADTGAFGFAAADPKKLRVRLGKASLTGSFDRMQIAAEGNGINLSLSLVPKKEPVLHGRNGYSRKADLSPLHASLYFSLSDLESRGTLKTGEGVFPVRGKSWFDRELFSRGLAENQEGWDWFSLQLDDSREIMLYQLRKKDGTLDGSSSGTIVYRDGSSRHLEKKDFTVSVKDRYRSKKTGARYPSKWEVSVPSEKLVLTIVPLLEDQEFTEAGAIRNLYWEGTCRVEGTSGGRAYVEMTGYGKE